MTCPACGADVTPEPIVHDLTVCQACARTLAMVGDTARLATAEDTRGLSDTHKQQLRRARPKDWRDAVLATKDRLKAEKAAP